MPKKRKAVPVGAPGRMVDLARSGRSPEAPRAVLGCAATMVMMLAGCGESERTDPAATSANGWHLEEEVRIVGPTDGFGVIEAVAADNNDNIYVLDRMAQQVFVFDASGAYSHAIGRRGEGPGELSRASGVSVGPDNRIWVPDPATARVSVFEPNGAFVAALPRRGQGYPGTGAWDRSVGSDGRYTDWRIWFPNRVRGGLPAETQVFPVVLPANAEGGDAPPEGDDAAHERRDSFPPFPPLEYTAEMVEVGGRTMYRDYFAGSLLYALEGGRTIWFGHAREYRVYKRSLNGDTLLVVSLDETPASVLEADVEAVRELLGDRPDAGERLAALPDEKPILKAVFADGAGTLYVVPESEAAPAGTAVDAFGPEGQYLGRAMLPEPVKTGIVGSLPAYATTQYLLLASMGDDLEPYVIRLGIRRRTP